ncbi:MAG: hypothetical protein ACXWEY_16235 [Bacteroidia bacterium]
MKKLTGKYEVKELNGINCAVVEEGITRERAYYIGNLLAANSYQVQVEEKIIPPKTEEEDYVATYTVGVQDITFNLPLALYSRKLKTPEGKILDHAYWSAMEEAAVST